MLSPKHFHKTFLLAIFPFSNVNSVQFRPQNLKSFFYCFFRHILYPIPQKVLLALPSKYSVDLSASTATTLSLDYSKWSFSVDFPMLLSLLPTVLYIGGKTNQIIYTFLKTLQWLPILLESEVLVKACKAYPIWTSITSPNSSLTISSSFTLLQPYRPSSLFMLGMLPTQSFYSMSSLCLVYSSAKYLHG